MYWAMELAMSVVRNRWKRFAKETRAETTVMTNIMLLAIAAMVVAGLYFFGKSVWDYMMSFWNQTKTAAPNGATPFKPSGP
jgi:hypothetical protein